MTSKTRNTHRKTNYDNRPVFAIFVNVAVMEKNGTNVAKKVRSELHNLATGFIRDNTVGADGQPRNETRTASGTGNSHLLRRKVFYVRGNERKTNTGNCG